MSVATKARELLADLEDVATHCPHCNGQLSNADGRFISLDFFDPPHGRSEVSYAESKGFIERDSADPMRFRLTPRGREHLARKPRSDSDAGKRKGAE